MVLRVLNFLHRKGYRAPLNAISRTAYFLKGFGPVAAQYYPEFRAYGYKVEGILYLSPGPGWASHFRHLHHSLQSTYNHYVMPGAGHIVVDIGAGLGEETSIYAQLVGPQGRVIAVEANPRTHAGLAYMCNVNNFNWVTPLNTAIYFEDGEVTIEDDEENYLINTIGTKSGNIKVKAKTLDAIVKENNLTRIDFLKSNIEGAEQFLIQGMSSSVSIIRNVCISCHDFRHVYHQHGEFYMTKAKVTEFLRDHGFATKVRQTGNRVVDDYIYGTNTKLA